MTKRAAGSDSSARFLASLQPQPGHALYSGCGRWCVGGGRWAGFPSRPRRPALHHCQSVRRCPTRHRAVAGPPGTKSGGGRRCCARRCKPACRAHAPPCAPASGRAPSPAVRAAGRRPGRTAARPPRPCARTCGRQAAAAAAGKCGSVAVAQHPSDLDAQAARGARSAGSMAEPHRGSAPARVPTHSWGPLNTGSRECPHRVKTGQWAASGSAPPAPDHSWFSSRTRAATAAARAFSCKQGAAARGFGSGCGCSCVAGGGGLQGLRRRRSSRLPGRLHNQGLHAPPCAPASSPCPCSSSSPVQGSKVWQVTRGGSGGGGGGGGDGRAAGEGACGCLSAHKDLSQHRT